MGWNYRIVKRRDKTLGIHVVTYDEDGRAVAMSDAVTFTASASQGIQKLRHELTEMFKDVKRYPVFEEPAPGKWPGRGPGSG